MMRTLLKRGFSQRSQMEVELLAIAWMLLGGNGGGRMGGVGAGRAQQKNIGRVILLFLLSCFLKTFFVF